MYKKLILGAISLLYANNCTATRLKNIDVDHSEMQGNRPSMEDALVALPFGKLATGLAFFGLYDGHGGALAAKAAAEGFNTRYGTLLKPIHQRLLQTISAGRYRFIDAFLSFDAEFRESGDDSGTTAVAALVDTERYHNKDVLYIGWVGDSRAILVNNSGKVVYETRDHKIDEPSEAARLKNVGAVISRQGIPRIAGLAIPRALGDRSVKNQARWQAYGDEVIIAEPDVERIDLTPEHQFLILACDGVWDVMSSQVAATLVHSELQKGMTLHAAAQRVRDMAYNRGSNDNISVMVVRFNW
jgi:protein phosphatase 2C family protein 2/3